MLFVRIAFGLFFCASLSSSALAVTQREIHQIDAVGLSASPISSLTPDGSKAIIGCGDYRFSQETSSGVCLVGRNQPGGQIVVVSVGSGAHKTMRLREDPTDDNAFAFATDSKRLFVVDGNQGLNSERPYSSGRVTHPYQGWITSLDLETGARVEFAKLERDTTCTSLWITKQGLLCHQMRYGYQRAASSSWVLFDLENGAKLSERRIGNCGRSSGLGARKWGEFLVGTTEDLGHGDLQACAENLYSLRDGGMAYWKFDDTFAKLKQVVTTPGGCAVLVSEPRLTQEILVICDGGVRKHLQFDTRQVKYRVLDALDAETVVAVRTDFSSGPGRMPMARLVTLNWETEEVTELFPDAIGEVVALWDHEKHRLYDTDYAGQVVSLDPVTGAREKWKVPGGFTMATQAVDLPLTMGIPVERRMEGLLALWDGGASRQLSLLDFPISRLYYRPSCSMDERECLLASFDARENRVHFLLLTR